MSWELGLASLLLLLYPSVTGGLGWRAAFDFVPDLTLVVLAVSLLWLCTGGLRILRLTQAFRTKPHGFRVSDDAAGT